MGMARFASFEMSLKALLSKYINRILMIPFTEKPEYVVNNFRVNTTPLSWIKCYSLFKIFTVDHSRFL
jgi:hypothetical protein